MVATTSLPWFAARPGLEESAQSTPLHVPRTSSSRRFESSSPLTESDHVQREPVATTMNTVADEEKVNELAQSIVNKLRSVRRPVIIGDFYAQRFGFGEEVRELCRALGVRYFGSESRSRVGGSGQQGY